MIETPICQIRPGESKVAHGLRITYRDGPPCNQVTVRSGERIELANGYWLERDREQRLRERDRWHGAWHIAMPFVSALIIRPQRGFLAVSLKHPG